MSRIRVLATGEDSYAHVCVVCVLTHYCRLSILSVQMIVATDVAARGLDIPGVDMVFHYRLPNEKVSVCMSLCYLHQPR